MVRATIKIPSDTEGQTEWAIIEMQGDLETRYPVPLSGKFIGDLYFTHKDAPVLIIGHHILHGKVVTLEKPIAVLSKSSPEPSITSSGMDVTTQNESQVEPTGEISCTYLVQAIIKKKLLFKTRPKPIIAHVPKKL